MSGDKKILSNACFEHCEVLGPEQDCAGPSRAVGVARPKQSVRRFFCNHLLAARRLHFFWRAPWALLAQNESDFNLLETTAGREILGGPLKADPENFQNAIQQTRASGAFEEMRALWVKVRTWFVENWDKWQEIEISDECAKNSIGKMAKKD